MSNNLFETLLGGLTQQNYDSLIFRESLRISGWKFHYIIDPDIITNYCFPHGIDPEKLDFRRQKKYTSSYYADEQIALHSIFYLNETNQQVNVFDEYLPEIRGMLRLAQILNHNDTNLGKIKLKNAEIHLQTDSDNKEEFKFRIRNEFSEIIANLLFRVDGIHKFSKLFEEKRFVVDVDDIKKEDIRHFFNNNYNVPSIVSYIEKKFHEQYYNNIRPFESTKRDSIAVLRAISINNSLIELNARKGTKELFLFIGDSPVTARVYNTLASESGNSPLSYPQINGTPIPLYYSIQEYFAHMICRKYDYKNRIDNKKTMDNLLTLKVAAQEIQSHVFRIKKSDSIELSVSENFQQIIQNHKKLFSTYSDLRNSYENIGLLENLTALISSLKVALEGSLFDIAQKIYDELTRNSNEVLNELVAEKENLLKKLILEANFNTSFLRGVDSIKNNNSNFILTKGIDPIEGSFQHLPVFIVFKNSEENSIYENTMVQLSEMILNHDSSTSKQLINKLENLLIKLNETKSKNSLPPEEKLIKAFISLILPSELSVNGRENDLNTYEWLSTILAETEIPEDILSEFWYVFIWVTRRIKKYSESIEYCKKGVSKFQIDPRFLHGLFLVKYCEYTEKEQSNISDVEEMLQLAQDSQYKYSLFIKQNYTLIKESAIDRIDECFTNNFCFLLTEKTRLLISNENEIAQNTIEKARQKLVQLKKSWGFLNNFSEYYDTEAYLEYIESFFPKKFNSFDKLYNALIASEKAIEFATTSDLKEKYLMRGKNIQLRIESLK